VLCIRWYLSFKLSSRDLVRMMAERGVVLSHTTILRWVQCMFRSSKSAGAATSEMLMVPGDVTRPI